MFLKKICLSFILITVTSFLYCAASRTVLVAGFINQGEKTENSLNLVITKSISTFLDRLPGIDVIPYTNTASDTKIRDYLNAGNIDRDKLLGIAQDYRADIAVTGDYKVDSKKNRISIDILAYNVLTGELSLKKNYEGGSGEDVFEQIDLAIEDISFLLMSEKITIAAMNVSVEGTGNAYRLFINGKFQKEIRQGSGFNDKVPAGQDLAVSLRESSRGVEVFNNIYNLKQGETALIKYIPSGNIEVRAEGLPGAQVNVDGKPAGQTGSEGILSLPGLKSGVRHHIQLIVNGQVADEGDYTVEESKTMVIMMKASVPQNQTVKNQRNELEPSEPKWNIRLNPGLSGFTFFMNIVASNNVYNNNGSSFREDNLVPQGFPGLSLDADAFLRYGAFNAWLGAGDYLPQSPSGFCLNLRAGAGYGIFGSLFVIGLDAEYFHAEWEPAGGGVQVSNNFLTWQKAKSDELLLGPLIKLNLGTSFDNLLQVGLPVAGEISLNFNGKDYTDNSPNMSFILRDEIGFEIFPDWRLGLEGMFFMTQINPASSFSYSSSFIIGNTGEGVATFTIEVFSFGVGVEYGF